MTALSPELLRDILRHYPLRRFGTHGLPHWARVLELGQQLARLTGADPLVVELFAVFHDSQRQNDGRDPGHGQRGAALARQLCPGHLGVTGDRLDLLVEACSRHTDGLTDGDVTLQTCWDADRLDLARAGIMPAPDRLCTEAARRPELISWASQRSLAGFRPTLIEERWQLGSTDG